MNVRDVWNGLEAVLVECGFPIMDADDVPQGRRSMIRMVEIPGENTLRGAFAAARVRLSFVVEVVLLYDTTNDTRVERKVAEDAERVIAAIYADVNLTNHHFLGAVLERTPGVIRNVIRFAFQGEAAL